MSTINERIKILIDELNITKTTFAESLNVSQPYISKLIRTGNPSRRLIADICEKYNVSEAWLTDGEGAMFAEKSRSEEIAEFAANLMKEEDESFKRRLIEALAKMDDDGWEMLEQLALEIVGKKKE